jgi:predicted nuclease of restriction endonuclease-like (RecB) superfamily
MNELVSQGYGVWLAELKQRIQSAQQRASLSVNRELILLYWQIGRDILERQKVQGWGAKVIDQLAHDLTAAFPDMKGFSRRNLLYMRSFAEQWTDLEFVQQAVAQIPWGHNILIITKCTSVAEASFYISQTREQGWSRDVLALQLKSGLYARTGKAVTNFSRTLPSPQSDLAQ